MKIQIQKMIKEALLEDLPNGDITTQALHHANRQGTANLIAKQDLYLSGSEFFTQSFTHLAPNSKINWYFEDSQKVLKGQTVAQVFGGLSKLLEAERTALNFLGKLSGIATLTNLFVEQIKHTKCKILDTRKTTPLYRQFEKKAVSDGGGQNHRLNLSDKIMLKENHIALAGGIGNAIESIRNHYSDEIFIEVEVQNLQQLKKVFEFSVDRIMLDNMGNEEMMESVNFVNGQCELEASGNMTLERVKSVAETGVDFISVGAITHSAPCADFSLLFEDLKSEHS